MSVILLRLEGVMQSWGIGSRFTVRHTEAEPTKSGVVGLISSALGRSREDSIEDLVELNTVVRVDREGQIFYDFHTTLDVLKANATGTITSSKLGNVISRRFYLSDACYLVGLEGENESLMRSILQALKTPKWPLFLGRKSFLPISPILVQDKLINKPLMEVIKSYPWLGRDGDNPPESLRLIYESETESGEPRLDVPVSYKSREFQNRNVSTMFIPFNSLSNEEGP